MGEKFKGIEYLEDAIKFIWSDNGISGGSEQEQEQELDIDKIIKNVELQVGDLKLTYKPDIITKNDERCKYLYSDEYELDLGLFENLSELKEYCHRMNKEMPPFIFGTRKTDIDLDIIGMLNKECHPHEDVLENVTDVEELVSDFDKWCKKQDLSYYEADRDCVILLDCEDKT